MILEARKENEFVFFKNSEAIEINLKTIIFIVKRPKKKKKKRIAFLFGDDGLKLTKAEKAEVFQFLFLFHFFLGEQSSNEKIWHSLV